MTNQSKHVFIIGSKGIPANYGGYETFVENLTKRRQDENIKYYVACQNAGKDFVYNNAFCFDINVPSIGPAKAVYYDYFAFKKVIRIVKEKRIANPIVYVLTCRIGPFYKGFVKKIHKLGGKVFLNPDGHEWLRSKWPWAIKKYWKLSEHLMVKRSDLIICDSLNIEKYIKNEYASYNPRTTYIAYGADFSKSELADNDKKLTDWYNKFNIKEGEYYLVVGRFVPENNFETIIREFMHSKTNKDLVLITNVEVNKFYKKLASKLKFKNDKRVKFVGTVYDEQLLKKIRENAFGYIHGHSVGGTNPSLLEALASTKLNLLYDVGFNREVGAESCFYFSSVNNSLKLLLDECDNFSQNKVLNLGNKAKHEIESRYSWNNIVNSYEKVFLNSSDN